MRNPAKRMYAFIAVLLSALTFSQSHEKGENLARQRRPHEAVPYIREALRLDPNNLDAYISAAFLQHSSPAIELLNEAEKRGDYPDASMFSRG